MYFLKFHTVCTESSVQARMCDSVSKKTFISFSLLNSYAYHLQNGFKAFTIYEYTVTYLVISQDHYYL